MSKRVSTKLVNIKKLAEYYSGILDQDGWETLFLTVTNDHPRQATKIIAILKKRR